MKTATEMTRKEFDALPLNKWGNDVGEFDSLIILPLRRMHESGYRCMDFVAVKGGEALCRLSGCSDVIHLDGIGGLGDWTRGGGAYPETLPPGRWHIDCLPKSGLLQLFRLGNEGIKVGRAASSFEVFRGGEGL